MFPVLHFLRSWVCPEYPKCERNPCPFSHEALKVAPAPHVASTNEKASLSSSTAESSTQIALKRPAPNSTSELQPANKQSRIDSRPSAQIPLKSALKSSVSLPLPNEQRKQPSQLKQTSTSSSSLSTQSSGQQNKNSLIFKPSQQNTSNKTNNNSSTSTSLSSMQHSTPKSRSFHPVITSTGPPQLNINPMKSHTDIKTRQSVIALYYKEFMRIYGKVSGAHTLSSEHALAQEQNVYDEAKGKVGYRNASAHALSRLRHRGPIESMMEAGTNEVLAQRKEEQLREMRTKMTLPRISKYIMSLEDLIKFDYVVEVPPGEGGDRVTEEECEATCSRCQTSYIVKACLSETERSACKFHPGKIIPTKSNDGSKTRMYTCCNMPPDATFCAEGAHVFLDKDIAKLHSRVGFITTDRLSESRSPNSSTIIPKTLVAKQKDNQQQAIASIVALDCELVFTTSGLSLARVTLLDETGATLIDELVRPIAPVIDVLTAFSGIQPGQLDDTENLVDIYTIRKILGMFIGPETVIIGHGLENDLKALRLVHKKVIDTAFLYPHRKGLPFRNSLKLLTREHLKLFIQDGPATQGHDSKTDALMALNLVRHKMCKENGPDTVKKDVVEKSAANDTAKENE